MNQQNTEKEKITHSARVVSIDIDGVIGVPEQEQFGSLDGRVATYQRFEEALEEVREGGADKLVLNIRSMGGDVGDALLIYDALRQLDIQVITRCYGYVASAATIIAQAASEGCRELSANSLYLIHCCESSVEGNTHNLSATQQLLEKSDQRLAEIYAEASGRTPEEFRSLMNENGGRGKWLSPDEAVAAGLADTIIAQAAISNDASEQVASLGWNGSRFSGDKAVSAKVSYVKSTGVFSGSYKVATTSANGKAKKTTVKFSGVFVDGVGYGATKGAAMPVVLAPVPAE